MSAPTTATPAARSGPSEAAPARSPSLAPPHTDGAYPHVRGDGSTGRRAEAARSIGGDRGEEASASATAARGYLSRLGGVAAFAVMLVLGGALLGWVRSMGGPGVLLARYGLWAPLGAFVGQLLVSASPIGEFVPWGIANGVLFGLVGGAGVNWVAWMGAAGIQHSIGRRTAVDFDFEKRRERLPRWLHRVPIEHPLFLICARWFPMGGTLVNLGAGALDVSRRRLLMCAAIGYLPQAVLVAAVGAKLLDLW